MALVKWKGVRGEDAKQVGQVTALKAGSIFAAFDIATQCVHRMIALRETSATEDAIPFDTLKECFIEARADLCY